jgi:iron complex outermembrane receptor protein
MFYITNRALEDQQVTTLGDGVLRNVAGAQTIGTLGRYVHQSKYERFQSRSFHEWNECNFNWEPLSEDMSYVDHIEFVKPSGFLMSNGELSGIYNIVTKNRQDSL